LVSKDIKPEVVRYLRIPFAGALTWKIVLKQINLKCEGLRVIVVIQDLNAVSHFFAVIASNHHFLYLLLIFRLFYDNLRLVRRLLNKIVVYLGKLLFKKFVDNCSLFSWSHGLDYHWHSRLS